jgi:hypothetical protein
MPLGTLSLPIAYAAAMGTGLACYLAAIWRPALGWAAILLILLSPAVFVCLAFGQTGLLTAACLLGGLRLRPTRPALAGVLFGLLLCKPQFALLIPLALLAARDWRCIAGAALTVAVLIALATAAFGWTAWEDWFAHLPRHGAYVDRAIRGFIKPTLRETLLHAGAPRLLASILALAVALAAAALVWRAFRRNAPAADLLLVAATFAAQPYAFHYDLPALGAAAILAWHTRPPAPAGLLDQAITAAILAAPATMMLTSRFHWIGAAATLLLLALAVARNRAPSASR